MKISKIVLAGLVCSFSSFAFDSALSADLHRLPAATALVASLSQQIEKRQTDDSDPEKRLLIQEFAQYKESRAKIKPEEAADKWLQLFKKCLNYALEQNRGDFYSYGYGEIIEKTKAVPKFNDLLEIIPAPETWAGIAEKLKSEKAKNTREALGLKIACVIIDMLLGDRKAVAASIEQVCENIPDGLGMKEYALQTIEEIKNELRGAEITGNLDDVKGNFTALLKFYTKKPAFQQRIKIPDLSGLAESEVKSLIIEALSISGLELDISPENPSKPLVRQIIIENIDKVTRPLWQLVNSDQDVLLFEALDKKFPETASEPQQNLPFGMSQSDYHISEYSGTGEKDYQRARARHYYLVGLLGMGRMEEALKLAGNLPDSSSTFAMFSTIDRQMPDSLAPEVLLKFEQEILREKPAVDLWSALVRHSSLVGSSAEQEARSFIEKYLASHSDFIPANFKPRKAYIELLLAIDEIDPAIEQIRAFLAAEDTNSENRKLLSKEQYELAVKLALLGRTLKKVELIEESVAGVLKAISSSDLWNHSYSREFEKYLAVLAHNGFGAQAVEIIKELISRTVDKSGKLGMSEFAEAGLEFDELLNRLTLVYYLSGEYEQVLELAKTAPWWNSSDIADKLTGYKSFAYSHNDYPEAEVNVAFPCMIARALIAFGRKSEASMLLKAYLFENSSDDLAYRLLVEIEGSALLTWLDTLYELDRFEERPLIWKARILLDEGKLSEAEEVIRLALKIDPTDGEQKAGDRVFGYKVLADILRARGKNDDAKFFDEVVASVRLAEEGDRISWLGMRKRSLEIYERASNLFIDAYCIQWRLAEKLYASGRKAEAEKHYEIAFERMPEQFGRMASLCFGCEGVFNRKLSKTVAQRILERLANAEKPKPQVFFLLGLLKNAQDLDLEAYRAFKRAVEIDPDYLDAWKNLANISRQIFLPASQIDELNLKLLELDPMQRRFSFNPQGFISYARIWQVFEKARISTQEFPQSLFRFDAAAARIDKLEKQVPGMRGRMHMFEEARRKNMLWPLLSQNQIVQKIMNFSSYTLR